MTKIKLKNNEIDFYDRLIGLSVLKRINPFLKEKKELILYLFFGVLAFLVSVGSFAVCVSLFSINELISNVISWILAVLFAYFTNKKYVFQSQTTNMKQVITEIIRFFSGRIITLIVEEAIIFIFITTLGFNSIIIKVIAQIVVIVLNYIVSKFFVFKKKT